MKFTRVIVIESLEDYEVKTGRINADLIAGKLSEAGKAIPVEYHECDSGGEFSFMVNKLVEEVEEGSLPLLHVECHGDPVYGLEFRNGSMLSWEDLAGIISKLNIASGFNLMLCMSACHAARFLGQMGTANRPCPCRVLIAPIEMVDPADCLSGFRVFYSELFSKFAFEDAIAVVEGLSVDHGGWLGETAESWFSFTSRGYVRDQCSSQMVKQRVYQIYMKLRRAGVEGDIRAVKKEFMLYAREKMFQTMFEQFFALRDRPDLRGGFQYLLDDLLEWIAVQRKLGLCAV